jgi:hypothetical protein
MCSYLNYSIISGGFRAFSEDSRAGKKYHACLRTRRRRLDQDLAAVIAPDVLSQEIEARLHMRDLGLLVRELEPSFLQEMGHERLDLITKEVLRCAGDQEVIRRADQVDLGLPLSLPRVGEAFRQQPLQSIQGPVRQDG